MNELENKKYLPIGSVVLLKDATKKIMITGFCVVPKENQDKEYDYCGCLYPEGIISSETNVVFNHNQIDKVYSTGYIDEEEKSFKERLVSVKKGIDDNTQI